MSDVKGNYAGVHNSYSYEHDISAKIKSAATGAYSSKTVPATITQTVPKKTVLKNLLANAKKGGRFIVGGHPIIRGASTLATAYSLVADIMKEEGYAYDPQQQDFVTAKDWLIMCRYLDNVDLVCGSMSEEERRVLQDYHKRNIVAERPKMDAICRRFVPHPIFPEYEYHTWETSRSPAGGSCMVILKGDTRTIVSTSLKLNDKRRITQSEFDRIMEKHVDANPTPFVNATAPADDMPIPGIRTDPKSVSIANGTIAQSAPYTTNGQAQQTRWNFSTTADGKTTVREIHIPRPDLTPDSPQAPTVTPLPETGDETDTGDGGASTPKPPEIGLCDQYPDILACDKMGRPEEGMFDDIKIPHVTDERTWTEDLFLPSDGVCPAPKTFHVFGKPFQVSYEPLCELMRKIRFAVLIAFILMSAKIVFGGLRSK